MLQFTDAQLYIPSRKLAYFWLFYFPQLNLLLQCFATVFHEVLKQLMNRLINAIKI
jgi:hypothetical protein